MTAILKIRPFGNSAGVILPKEELDRFDLKVGDELAIRPAEGGFELSPYDPEFSRRVRAFERSLRKFRNTYRELAKQLPAWLERRDVEFHYEELMSRYGGLSGPASEDALAATLARPQQQLAYEPDGSLFDLAAAYGYGFARNHCFPDGNKRIALAAMDVFLMLNGHDLVPDEAEAVVIVNALASGEYSQDELANWLERNSSYLPEGEIQRVREISVTSSAGQKGYARWLSGEIGQERLREICETGSSLHIVPSGRVPLRYLRIGLGANLSKNIRLANEWAVLTEEREKMKPEDDGLILMVKRELGEVEASLSPIDAYYRQAREDHDAEKIKRYADERSALIRARDRLHQEIKELEDFDALQDHHRNAITAACEGLKDKLAHFVKTHG